MWFRGQNKNLLHIGDIGGKLNIIFLLAWYCTHTWPPGLPKILMKLLFFWNTLRHSHKLSSWHCHNLQCGHPLEGWYWIRCVWSVSIDLWTYPLFQKTWLRIKWCNSQHPASISSHPYTISCMMVTIDQSVSSISKISCCSALELVDRMWDTLVMGEEDGRKVVSMRGSGGLRYSLLRVHPASNIREEDSHT